MPLARSARSLLAAVIVVSLLGVVPGAAQEAGERRDAVALLPERPLAPGVAPLSPEDLAGISGGAGGPAVAADAGRLPGVRLWDEWTPRARRPSQDGEVTVNGIRVR